MNQKFLKIILIIISLFSFTTLSSLELVNNEKFTSNLYIEAGIGIYNSRVDYSGKNRDNVFWSEYYFIVDSLNAYHVNKKFDLLLDFGVDGALTVGSGGDAGGYANNGDANLNAYQISGGFKVNNIFKGTNLKITAGKQPYSIARGFILKSDSFNMGSGAGSALFRGGAYMSAPQRSFKNSALIDLIAKDWNLNFFYLDSDTEITGNLQQLGGNIDYTFFKDEKLGNHKLGITYIDIFELETVPSNIYNHNLNVFNLRYYINKDDFNFYYEFVYEYNKDFNTNSNDVKAYATYAETSYKFSKVLLKPEIGYRFSYFTGDKGSTDDYEGFDPLFYGWENNGTWFQGQVSGNYASITNSNSMINAFWITVSPLDRLNISLKYYHYIPVELDTSKYLGSSDELDVFMDIWLVKGHLLLTPIYAFTDPGKGIILPDGHVSTRINNYFELTLKLFY